MRDQLQIEANITWQHVNMHINAVDDGDTCDISHFKAYTAKMGSVTAQTSSSPQRQ